MNSTHSIMGGAPNARPNLHPSTLSSEFASLGLSARLVRAVIEEGYSQPTPIQARAIGPALEGLDLLCCAQTGTGKTAAFVLPMLHQLAERPKSGAVRALILAPTRELASQIGDSIRAYGRHVRLSHTVVFGGVSQRAQEGALRRRPDIVVATPGRLLDLLEQGVLSLAAIEMLVLDEADRMLDMGFIHDVRRILRAVPRERQTSLFSATISPDVRALAETFMRSPVEIAVSPKTTSAETVRQSVHHVPRAEKRALLERLIKEQHAQGRVIVFTRTKHGANRLSDQLERSGIRANAIHGNKSQGARERALQGFRDGTTPVLVATDIAARGIDVDEVALVVNYELPEVPESYVHRIGRTGRAGHVGMATSFCDETERLLLRDIEKLLASAIPIASGSAPAPARYEPKAPLVMPGDSARSAHRKRRRF